MTESSAEVRAQTIGQQHKEMEARVSLLQAQLDRAYEEIAEKDSRLSSLSHSNSVSSSSSALPSVKEVLLVLLICPRLIRC